LLSLNQGEGIPGGAYAARARSRAKPTVIEVKCEQGLRRVQ
jgi:hypothetical protein